MKTVLITPYELNVSGVVDYYIKNNILITRYSFNCDSPVVMHLVAMSSRKPSNLPMKIDVPVFEGSFAGGEKKTDASRAAYLGYFLDDIDTFALVYDKKRKIAAQGFTSLYWDIRGPVASMTENRNPVNAAEKLLGKIKTKALSDDEYEKILKFAEDFSKSLTSAENMLLGGYQWYELTQLSLPMSFTAYRHLTETDEFCKTYQNSRQLLFGVKNGCHTALALRSEGENPFVNAEDCAVHCDGFWIVGVYLAKDGQYFEKPELKQQVGFE